MDFRSKLKFLFILKLRSLYNNLVVVYCNEISVF